MSPRFTYDFDVFLSYSRDDTAWVERLVEALQLRGCKPWRDTDRIVGGELWARAIEEALEASRAYGIVVTQSALSSKWVQEEYYSALTLANSHERDLPIVVILRESTKEPLFLFLRNRQRIDFRDDIDFDRAVESLYHTLAALPAAPPAREHMHGSESPLPASTVSDAVDATRAITLLRRRRERDVDGAVVKLWASRAASTIFFAGTGFMYATAMGLSHLGLLLVIHAAASAGLLLAWGLTSRHMARLRDFGDELWRLEERIELCGDRVRGPCGEAWRAFWQHLHESAGVRKA